MGTNLRRCISRTLVAVATLVAFSATAHATVIDWNTWTSSTAGTLATYSGGSGLVANYPSYTPIGTFADGIIVDNGPTSANGILKITGGNLAENTVFFNTPVLNPVMAIWSLGQGGIAANFTFTTTPTFVSGGPSAEYSGSPITVLGNVVSGIEGNGTVQFLGTFTEISWTNSVYENWYGFNVGAPVAAPVPEPGTMVLLAGGFLGLAIYGKRRKNA